MSYCTRYVHVQKEYSTTVLHSLLIRVVHMIWIQFIVFGVFIQYQVPGIVLWITSTWYSEYAHMHTTNDKRIDIALRLEYMHTENVTVQ